MLLAQGRPLGAQGSGNHRPRSGQEQELEATTLLPSLLFFSPSLLNMGPLSPTVAFPVAKLFPLQHPIFLNIFFY